MASNANRKPGLTTFGWLLLGGAAAAVLGSKSGREKVRNTVKGFTDKAAPSEDSPIKS